MTENNSPVITSYPDAPVPTRFTRLNRQNPLTQGVKFLLMCGNIMMMVIKGHEE